MKVIVVIGCSFGDEGKGHMVNYFSQKNPNSVVVRYSGGPQSTHTVNTKTGKRHVFGIIGSGTFSGSPTYLSEFTLVQPHFLNEEYYELYNKTGNYPKIYVNQECPIITPFDIIMNRALETQRGDKRHGSCGMGINETVERTFYSRDKYKLIAKDLSDLSRSKEILYKIQNEWMLERAFKLGINLKNNKFSSYFNKSNDILIENTINSFYDFTKNVHIGNSDFVCNECLIDKDTVIFEGTQGLLLDESRKDYAPNLTRSSVGLKNALNVVLSMSAIKNKIDMIEVCYVSRPYLTRHGAGRMDNEADYPPYKGIVEKTNFKNDYQGTFRYGYLNFDELYHSIISDFMTGTKSVSIIAGKEGILFYPTFSLTCCDQLRENNDTMIWMYSDAMVGGDSYFSREMNFRYFAERVKSRISGKHYYLSHGPTCEEVKCHMS